MSDNISNTDDENASNKNVVNIKVPPVKEKVYRSFQEISKIDWVDIPEVNKKNTPEIVISPVEIMDDEQSADGEDNAPGNNTTDNTIDESNYISFLSSDGRDNWIGDKH